LVTTNEGVSGFLPNSHTLVKLAEGENPASLVGKTIKAYVLELSRSANKIIFSQKKVMSVADFSKATASLKKGEKITVVVTNITSFGVFAAVTVNDSKLDGLIHISEVSWDKVSELSGMFEVGEELEVKVGSELIKLGLKNGDDATKLLATYLFNDNNLVLLGTISKDIKTAEEVGGLEARQAALKKEFNGLMKMIEGKEKVDGDIIVHVQDRPAKEGTKSVVRAPNNKPKVEPPSFTNKTQWSHSTAGEFKNGIFQGGHSKGSLPSGSTVRKIGTENAQGVYKAEVTVIYDGVPQTRPKTMFPDSWDEPKIKVEVESAFSEREIVLVDKGNGLVDTIYRGKSKSGVTIEFHIDEFDKSYNFFPIYE
jgi:hypothetical protein